MAANWRTRAFWKQITALLIGLNIRYKGGRSGIRITGLPPEAYRSQ